MKAKKVDIIVAFLMELGVKLLEENLKALAERNIPVRILTQEIISK
jgi:HKD family nuclease